MAGDHPVQNSEVYLMGSTHCPSIPPPSPPSPATPCEESMSPPLDDLMSMTPPLNDALPTHTTRLTNAVHVLSTEATALSCLTRLYETDPVARVGFNSAVEAITRFRGDKGKLVISGVGKSGHIAKKLVATMNSLKIHATYLHPTEALHGDLGKVGKHDTILLITFSGKTPELLALLPHFDAAMPLIILTSHTHPSTCEIVRRRPDAILLPAPIHRSETDSFGFPAPTTSTTMALAIGDALAVVISMELHIDVAAVFSRYHPGGAIGEASLLSKSTAASTTNLASNLSNSNSSTNLAGNISSGPTSPSHSNTTFPSHAHATNAKPAPIPLLDIPDIGSLTTPTTTTAAHILLSAYRSPNGWVRCGVDAVIPPSRIAQLVVEDMDMLAVHIKGLVVGRGAWARVLSGSENQIDGGRVMLVVDGEGEEVGVMEN